MIRLAAAFATALAVCVPAAAQQTPAPDPCGGLSADTPVFPWLDGLTGAARDAGASEDTADLEAACREAARKEREKDAGQKRRDDASRRFDAVPGPGSLPGGEAVAADSYEAQRLRTAHRINQQGIRTAQRGDWIAALHMFEMAARYAPRDPVIQRNLAEARVRAARQAEELRRQQQRR